MAKEIHNLLDPSVGQEDRDKKSVLDQVLFDMKKRAKDTAYVQEEARASGVDFSGKTQDSALTEAEAVPTKDTMHNVMFAQQEKESVFDPGELAWQAARGFAISGAHMLEFGEGVLNAVGAAFDMDEENKIRLGGKLARHIKEEVGGEAAPKFWADKVAYYIGYMIPDLVGIVATGGIAGGVAKVGGAALSKKLAVSSMSKFLKGETLVKGAQVMGRIGYGTAKGGVLHGEEGAVESFKQFSMMEGAMHLFGGLSRPAQIVANAAFMSGYTGLTYDTNAPDYVDEVMAAGILGGGFGALGEKSKKKMSRDGVNEHGKTKSWHKVNREQGKPTGINDYMIEFLDLETSNLHKAHGGPDPIQMKAELRSRLETIRKKEVPAGDEALAKGLKEYFEEGGTVSAKEAEAFAGGLMKAADVLEKPVKYIDDELMGSYIKAHGDKIWVEGPEGPHVFETAGPKTEYVSPNGVKHLFTADEAQMKQKTVIRDELNRRTAQRVARSRIKETKGVRAKGRKLLNSLITAEGKNYWELEKLGAQGHAWAATAAKNAYNNMSWIDHRLGKMWERYGVKDLNPQEAEWANDILFAGRWVDENMKATLKGRKSDLPMTQKEAQFQIDNTRAEIIGALTKEHGSTYAMERLRAIDETVGNLGVVHRRSLINEQYDNHMLTKTARDAYLGEGEGNKFIRYFTATEWGTVENWLKLKDQKIYTETLSTKSLEKSLKANEGQPLMDDVILILEREYGSRMYAQEQNRGILEFIDVSDANPGKDLARATEWDYRDPKKGNRLLTDQEVIVAKEKIAQHDAARANSKAERELQKKVAGVDGTEAKAQVKEETLHAQISKLLDKVEAQEFKAERMEAWAAGDFTKHKITVKAKKEQTATKNVTELKEFRDSLSDYLAELEIETAKPQLTRTPREMTGFIPVNYLKHGFKETVMVNDAYAPLLKLTGGVGKEQSGIVSALSIGSGALPLRLLATTLNPIFGLKAIPRDLLHFSTANHLDKSNPIAYMKDFFLGDGTKLFKDVRDKGEWYNRYREAGGSDMTRTHLNIEEALLNNLDPPSKFKKRVTDTTIRMSRLNDTIEATLRVHAFKRMVEGKHQDLSSLGVSKLTDRQAAFEVNKMLNFSRKGNVMRYIDSVIPFANVAAQAFDAQVRSLKNNPSRYMAKMGTYWAARAGMITAAYMLAPETMDNVSPVQKLNNIIIPMGLSTAAGYGDSKHAYVALPTEKNPILAIGDAMTFAAIDAARGKDTESDWVELVGKYLGDANLGQYATAGMGIDSAPPAMSAIYAMYGNRDPRTGDNIWRGNPAVQHAARFKGDTSPLAMKMGSVLHADPIGIERAVATMTAGNMYTGFAGWFLHDVSQEEKENMSMRLTEALPGVKNMVKWTRPQFNEARDSISDNATAKQVEVYSVTSGLVEDVKNQEKSLHQVKRELKGTSSFDSLTRKSAERNIDRQVKGWMAFNSLRRLYTDSVMAGVPSLKEWEFISYQDSKSKAEWWVNNQPTSGTPEYKVFQRMRRIYLGDSNQLHYYKRSVTAL